MFFLGFSVPHATPVCQKHRTCSCNFPNLFCGPDPQIQCLIKYFLFLIIIIIIWNFILMGYIRIMVTNCKRKGKRKWIDKKPFLHLKPDFIFFFLFFGQIIRLLLKELNIVFTMVNTLNKKQMQIVQELNLIDCKNSKFEIHCVKPQMQAH